MEEKVDNERFREKVILIREKAMCFLVLFLCSLLGYLWILGIEFISS